MTESEKLRRIKVLELICSEIPPNHPKDEVVDVCLRVEDFQRQKLRFDEGFVVLLDLARDNKIAELHREFENNAPPPAYGWYASFLTWYGVRQSLDNEREPTNREKSPAKYDANKGVLYLKGRAIPISKRGIKTNAQYLLDYLYSQDDLSERPCFSEVAQAVFPNEPYVWKTWYRACESINQKVLKVVGVPDFLEFSSGKTGSVVINSEYRPSSSAED